MMSIASLFQDAFGVEPAGTATVPGRVNLIGEHTDYNGGNVLPAAIDRQVHVGFAPDVGDQFIIKSTRFDATVQRPVGDPKRDDWTDYAVGALNKARALGWLEDGARLLIESDIPDGAGVSSSAALITAILRAVAAAIGEAPDPVEIAKHARSVENDYIGMPCGIMDQMAVGLADKGKALALDTVSLDFDVIDIPSDWAFVVLHSGIRRELSDGRYKERFEECEAARQSLRADHLCRLNAAQDAAIKTLPAEQQRRVRHVVSDHKRAIEAVIAMRGTDFDTFGDLMNDSHASYAGMFEASHPGIDALVATATRLGARGARLTGGGFGGCIVALVEADKADAWTKAVLAEHPKAWRV
jgi:galactokinase